MKHQLGSPPRQISPELKQIIKDKSSISLITWIGIISMLLPSVILFSVNAMTGPHPGSYIMSGVAWMFLGITVCIIIGAVMWILDRKSKYTKLLTEGEVHAAKVIRVTETWNIRLNGWPRRTIEFTLLGEQMQLHTFDPRVVSLFQEKDSVKVLHHKELPGMVVPVKSLFFRQDSIQKQQVLRRDVSS